MAMAPVMLYPSRLYLGLMIAISVVLSGGGLLGILDGRGGGWLPFLFFLACGAVFVASLSHRMAGLVIDDDGFAMRTLGRETRYRWADVDSFKAGPIAGMPLLRGVSFRYRTVRPDGSTIDRPGLLTGSYGLGTRRLAELLTEARERALTRGTGGPSGGPG